jgi:glycosyltransferase involved in cell wall biosynthesis
MKYQVNIELQFAGPQYPPAMRKLVRAIKETKLHENIKYIGELDHKELHKIYSSADAFVFLSSCENMPNTLMEAMRSELPILCSDRSPMNEFLKDAGWYCNPEDADSVALGLEAMLLSQAKRRINAKKALSYSNEYSWEKCAMETYDFIMTIAKNNKCAE